MRFLFIFLLFLSLINCKNEKREEVVLPSIETKKIDTVISISANDTLSKPGASMPVIAPVKSEKVKINIDKVKIKTNQKPSVNKNNNSSSKTTEPPIKSTPTPPPSSESKPDKPIKISTDKNQAPPTKTETTPPIKNTAEKKDEEASSDKPDYSALNSFLKKYVSAGRVNYDGIKKDKNTLEAIAKSLAANPPGNGWTKNDRLAYWMNVYNVFTIKKVVDNYPLKKITDLNGGKPWDVKEIKIGSDTYSLNDIENKIIRPSFKDPRIHFGINCAAKSCPPLHNGAFTPENVSSTLTSLTKTFINNTAFNKISANKVEISKIFDWYKDDFNDIIDFLNDYSTTKVTSGTKVDYTEYNWDLNK